MAQAAACANRDKHMTNAKRRIQEKLDMIEEEKDGILQYVNSLTDKAVIMGESLLAVEERATFMQRLVPVMQDLEQCLNILFVVQAGLPDLQELEELTSGEPCPDSPPVCNIKQEKNVKAELGCQTAPVVKEEKVTCSNKETSCETYQAEAKPPLDSAYQAEAEPPLDSTYQAEAKPPLDSTYQAEAKPPLDSTYQAEAKPPLDSTYQAEAKPPLDSTYQAEAKPPLDSTYQAEAKPPLDSTYQAEAKPPLDSTHQAEAKPPLDSTYQAEAKPPLDSANQAEAKPPFDSTYQAEAKPPLDSTYQAEAKPPLDSTYQTEAKPLLDSTEVPVENELVEVTDVDSTHNTFDQGGEETVNTEEEKCTLKPSHISNLCENITVNSLTEQRKLQRKHSNADETGQMPDEAMNPNVTFSSVQTDITDVEGHKKFDMCDFQPNTIIAEIKEETAVKHILNEEAEPSVNNRMKEKGQDNKGNVPTKTIPSETEKPHASLSVDAGTDPPPKPRRKGKKVKTSKSKDGERDASLRMILNSLGMMSQKNFDTARGSRTSGSSENLTEGTLVSRGEISVPQFEIEGANYFNVMVVYVETPSLFWVQRISFGKIPPIKSLMNQIQKYHSQLKASDSGFLLNEPPVIGQVVCAKYIDGQWYRARVVRRYHQGCSSNRVEVFYIDYGNRHVVSASEIRPLHPQFACLPAQAIPCALDGIMPGDGSSYWTEQQVWHFGGLTLDKANICGKFFTADDCKVLFAELYIPEDVNPVKYIGQGPIIDNLSDVGELMIRAKKGRKAPHEEIILLLEDVWAREISTPKDPEVHSYLSQMKIVAIQSAKVVHGPHYHQWQKPSSDDTMSQLSQLSGDSASGTNQSVFDFVSRQFDIVTEKSLTAPTPKSPYELHINPGSEENLYTSTNEAEKTQNSQDLADSSSALSEVLYQRVEEILDQESTPQVSFPEQQSKQQNFPMCRNSSVSPVECSNLEQSQNSNQGNMESDNCWPQRCLTLPNKLREKGLPCRLPTACEKYVNWMESNNGQSVASEVENKSEPQEVMNAVRPETSPQEGNPVACSNIPSPSHRDESLFNSGSPSLNAELSFSDHAEEHLCNPLDVHIPEDNYITFLMSVIRSPSKFFVHLVTKDSQNALDVLMEKLDDYYVKTKRGFLSKLSSSFEPKVGKLCCARFTEDGSFYRAQVLNIKSVSSGSSSGQGNGARSPKQGQSVSEMVEVLYVDFGNMEWVSRTRVYPLPTYFMQFPAQAVPCCLAGVTPIKLDSPLKDDIKGAEPVNKPWIKEGWLEEACKCFVELTGYQNNLLGYVVEKDIAGSVVQATLENPLSLILVNTSAATEDVCINDELVRLGYARTVGHIPAVVNIDLDVPPNSEGVSDFPDHWDPMMADFLSERNTYAVDTDDAEVALVGYKSRGDKICHFFSRGLRCYKGDNCPFKHIPQPDVATTTDTSQVFCVNDLERTITPPEEDSWVLVDVTAIFNPGHFYVSFPIGTRSVEDLRKEEDCGITNDEGYGEEDLDSLMDQMRIHYSKLVFRDKDFTTYAPGEIVACKFSHDGRWCRAKILNDDPDHSQVEVFYVDFGNQEWIDEGGVRQMSPQFMHLPFQALECFLPLDPAGDRWSTRAREVFTELVDGKTLFAHIRNRGVNGILTVDLYDTEPQEEIFINQVLLDHGFAVQPDPKGSGSPARRRSHRSSRSTSGATSLSKSSSLSTVYFPG